MSRSGSALTARGRLDELVLRVLLSVGLGAAGIALYAFVPALQLSPYSYVLILLVGFTVAVRGLKDLLRAVQNEGRTRRRILEASALAAVALVFVSAYGRPLAATIQSLFR